MTPENELRLARVKHYGKKIIAPLRYLEPLTHPSILLDLIAFGIVVGGIQTAADMHGTTKWVFFIAVNWWWLRYNVYRAKVKNLAPPTYHFKVTNRIVVPEHFDPDDVKDLTDGIMSTNVEGERG